MNEVLNCDNPRRCLEVFRMKVEVFQVLCATLASQGGLSASKHIAVDEKVGMFLWTVANAASNRQVQERFQHSGDTVSRNFYQVLLAINCLAPASRALSMLPLMMEGTHCQLYICWCDVPITQVPRPIDSRCSLTAVM